MYTDYAVQLHTKTAQSGAAVHIDSIVDARINVNLRTGLEAGDGSPYATFGSLVEGGPSARFTTLDLKAFLDACGTTGMLIDRDATHPGVTLFFQSYAAGATRGGAGTHISEVFGNGILVPRTLTMNRIGQGSASLMAELVAVKQDAIEPMVSDEAASLPADVYPTVSAAWTLGPLILNATTIDKVQSAIVDFGIVLVAENADSQIYPTKVSIDSIRPSIVVAGLDVADLVTLTEEGAYYTATQVVLYARKKAEGATITADGTAEHIKLTLGKARIEPVSIDGTPKTLGYLITPWYTAGGSPVDPIAINTASAIT